MSEITTQEQAPLFTPKQLELIKRTVAVGATNDELAMFLHVCKKSGLDPFLRQIYFIKRQGKGTIQTGIDGYRAIAERSGQYAGNDEPVYDYDRDEAGKFTKLVKATVTVYKLIQGQRCAFSAAAYWDEHKPQAGQDFMWTKMPHVMLGKVAETLALRKAFPNDLSGLYTSEEMAQGGATIPSDDQTTAPQISEHTEDVEHLPVVDQETPASSVTSEVDPIQQAFPGSVEDQAIAARTPGPAELAARAKWSKKPQMH